MNLTTLVPAEIEQVAKLLWGTSLIWLLLVATVGWLLVRLLVSGKRVAWRLGLDPSHRLQVVARWGRLLVYTIVISVIFRRFFAAAPLLTSLFCIGGAATLLVALARPLQNAVSGASLILRGRIREGDHIELDGAVGIVSDVSMLRLHVRDAGGQTVMVPNRLLQERVVTVSRKTHLAPIVARATLPCADRRAVELARQAALLSPWRVPGTPVRACAEDDALVVELQTWTESAMQPGRQALEATIEGIATAALAGEE